MPEKGKWFQVLESKPYLLTLGLAGILVLVAGLGLMGAGLKPEAENIEIIETQAAISTGNIFIDIGGAVVKPGIYELPADARVNDALVAAGGLTDEADHARISQNLNLAQKLTDGVKIYVPFLDQKRSDLVDKQQGPTLTERININTASLAELDTLWGIGPVTAQKIIDGRPYSRIEELLEKKIVKTNVFEAIKDFVTVL